VSSFEGNCPSLQNSIRKEILNEQLSELDAKLEVMHKARNLLKYKIDTYDSCVSSFEGNCPSLQNSISNSIFTPARRKFFTKYIQLGQLPSNEDTQQRQKEILNEQLSELDAKLEVMHKAPARRKFFTKYIQFKSFVL
jgi:hypothetical protein